MHFQMVAGSMHKPIITHAGKPSVKGEHVVTKLGTYAKHIELFNSNSNRALTLTVAKL